MAEDDKSQDVQERALIAAGGRIWFVFDEPSIDDGEPLVVGWNGEMLREKAAAGENVWRAGSIAELAVLAGIDAAGLEQSVAAWNEACRTGSDPLGRAALEFPIATAPFYAVLSDGVSVTSWGGVAVDGELRVVDAAGQVIPGLSAAGEVLGCAATMGDAFCSGMAVTPAMSLGRWLGRRLAREAGAAAPAVAEAAAEA